MNQKDKNENDQFDGNSGIFEDNRDNKLYVWTRIGNQIVMAENFAYKPSHGINFWDSNNSQYKSTKEGFSYDWVATKIIAPQGWHLPTKEEWETLYNYLGGNSEEVFNAIKKGGSSGFDIEWSDALWSATLTKEREAWCFACDHNRKIAFMVSYELNHYLSVRFFRD